MLFMPVTLPRIRGSYQSQLRAHLPQGLYQIVGREKQRLSSVPEANRALLKSVIWFLCFDDYLWVRKSGRIICKRYRINELWQMSELFFLVNEYSQKGITKQTKKAIL